MHVSGTLLVMPVVWLVMVGPVVADQRLDNTIAHLTVFGSTNQYTPPVYEMWTTSYPCWTNFHGDVNFPALAERLQHIPLPCYFVPSAGADGEAVLLDHGLHDGQEFVVEVWQMGWEQDGAHVAWGGADDAANFVVHRMVARGPSPTVPTTVCRHPGLRLYPV